MTNIYILTRVGAFTLDKIRANTAVNASQSHTRVGKATFISRGSATQARVFTVGLSWLVSVTISSAYTGTSNDHQIFWIRPAKQRDLVHNLQNGKHIVHYNPLGTKIKSNFGNLAKFLTTEGAAQQLHGERRSPIGRQG